MFSNVRNLALPEATEADNPLVGSAIFVVFGNGDTLADSTAFAIVDAGALIGTDAAAPAPESSADVVINDAFLTTDNLIVGDLVTDVDLGLPINFNEGIQLVGAGDAVPEPSTSLLAGLAALGLVARRRR